MEAEFGDLFFSLINAARLYDINPENALERTNKKFISRFNYLESKTLSTGRDLKQMSLEEMDKIWNEAKKFRYFDTGAITYLWTDEGWQYLAVITGLLAWLVVG